MDSKRSRHHSDEQLARFQDRELPPHEAGLLETCPECRGRLRDMELAAAAYVEYRDSVREPLLPSAPRPWASLENLVERHEARPTRHTIRRWLMPALGAAFCAVVAVLAVLRNAQEPSSQTAELLERSANRETPHRGRYISV